MNTSSFSFRSALGGLVCAGLLGSFGGAVAATAETPATAVVVQFVHPEKFTDLQDQRNTDERVRQAYLDDLRHTIERRAADKLGAGSKLTVTITDVDMAGQIEFGVAAGRDIRSMKPSSPPRIDLTFELTDAGGRVLKTGVRHLTDLAFLTPERRTTSEPLFFEKRLLSTWLDSELGR